MRHETGEILREDGTRLFTQQWQPDGAVRAQVVLVHGVNEHSGRYAQVVTALTDAGYAVAGYDHRGHGRSTGHRVHLYNWSEYRDDLHAVIHRLQHAPVFLYGHSMGSMVVADYLLHHATGIQGAILSGLPIQPVGIAKPALVHFARMLSQIWPRYAVDLGIDPADLSRDPEVLQAYRDDPLCTRHATARWCTEILACIERVKARVGELQLPLLVLHGGADPLNHPDGARWLQEQAGSSENTLKVYPGGYHEPHNDLEAVQVVRDVVTWLDGQLPE